MVKQTIKESQMRTLLDIYNSFAAGALDDNACISSEYNTVKVFLKFPPLLYFVLFPYADIHHIFTLICINYKERLQI